MKHIIVRLLAIFVTLATLGLGQAQQPAKIPRIGYLGAFPLPPAPPSLKLSGKGCASLATWRAGTFSLITAGRRERPIGS